MRPVLQENKISRKLWVFYIVIFIVCTIGIGIALYMQFYQDENLGAVIGIPSEDSEKENEYNELKEEFNTIFTNGIEVLQVESINTPKINNKYDYVVTAYTYKKDEENSKINVAVPYINIDDISARNFNAQIGGAYKERAEALVNQISNIDIIYTVEYKAYIQNNILSMIIRSEFKEGSKSQKVSIKTFNYDLIEKKEIGIDKIIDIKKINVDDANNKIKKEIKEIQEQNNALEQAIGQDGGEGFYKRDLESKIYDITNSEQFLYGKDGMLYIIYAYGNYAETNEMDIVIFK